MRVERNPDVAGPVIQGLSPGGFRVDGTIVPALLMTADRADAWTPPPLGELGEGALGTILAANPEFLLLGTGARLVHPPRPFVRALEARGIGVEPMDSRAAARAWGVLRAEGRRVAAALYPLDA